MSALDELTDSNNWMLRTDYSTGNIVIYEWNGELYAPIQHAAADLAALRAENERLAGVAAHAITNADKVNRALRERVKELEQYHGFHMGLPVPEGEPTVAEERLRSERDALKADADRLATIVDKLRSQTDDDGMEVIVFTGRDLSAEARAALAAHAALKEVDK